MKVTDFVVILFVITSPACTRIEGNEDQLAFQQKIDSTASRQIDSAYIAINQQCDTAYKYILPKLVDSLLELDTITRPAIVR